MDFNKEGLVYFLGHLNIFLTYVRDRKHTISVHEKYKRESLYIKLHIAPNSLHSFSFL